MSQTTNMNIEVAGKDRLRQLAKERGMKLLSVPRLLSYGWEILTAEQRAKAESRFQADARKPRRRPSPAS